MSNKIKWSHELRVRLYAELTILFGNYSSTAFDNRGKPKNLTKKEWINVLHDVGFTLGLGNDKGGAINNQIAWVFCVPSEKCHQGHWNTRRRNVLAAFEAGWTMPARPEVIEAMNNLDSEVYAPSKLGEYTTIIFLTSMIALMFGCLAFL